MELFDALQYPYPSRRNAVFARRAMVCASIPQSAEIGLAAMRSGGNAVDAAVAMAAAMPVLEPTGNALGSDCFALVWMEREKKLYGLNASGTAPTALNAETVRALGFSAVPKEGWLPTMVGGAPAGWAALSRRFGTVPLSELFAPAIEYAEEGVCVAPNVARQWNTDAQRIRRAMLSDPVPYAAWWDAFMKPDGSAYAPGDIFRLPALAETLRELARTDCESYYRGAIADRIVRFSEQTGGYFSHRDFSSYAPVWVEPISTDYHGYTVCELPPNGHGITVLMALNILSGMALPKERESAEYYHAVMEALKLSFADTMKYVADPRCMHISVQELLSPAYASERRSLIGNRALMPTAGRPHCGGTVYFCTADRQGNMVSFIQSNYTVFGSGVLIPGTGIALQNRGSAFSLDPDSDNCLAGGKRAYHTIIPGFLMKGGEAVGPFGVMGAFMQPQGHVEVLTNMIDYRMNPQAALDAPRIQWVGGKRVQAEAEIAPEIIEELRLAGHEVEVVSDRIKMGRGQIILRTDGGVLVGGTEPRCDGSVAAW